MSYFLEKDEDCPQASWQKITRKTVDPITFYCIPNVEHAPRIEDCSYETTGMAWSEPRIPLDPDLFPKKKKNGSSRPSLGAKKSSSKKLTPTDFAPWESSSSSHHGSSHDKMDKKSSSSHSKSRPKYLRSASENSSKTSVTSTKSSSSSNTHRRSSSSHIPASPASTSSSSDKKKSKKKLSETRSSVQDLKSKFGGAQSSSKSTGESRASFQDSKAKFEAALKKSETSPNRIIDGDAKPTLGSFLKTMADDAAKSKTPSAMGDEHSIGSRSLASLSIADRSNAEMSKSEKQLFNKSKHHKPKRKPRTGGGDGSSSSSNQKQEMGALNKFFNASTIAEGDENLMDDTMEIEVSDAHSVMSGSTLGTKSITERSIAERSANETRLKNRPKGSGRAGGPLNAFMEVSERSLSLDDIGPVVKKLRFQEGHEVREIPYPTASMYEDLFWDEDELAEFRYEAFMEEAGLDINDFG
jgi:hypothetical protein